MTGHRPRGDAAQPMPLRRIAEAVGGEVIGPDDIPISGINSLEGADSGEITFYSDRRYAKALRETRASAVLVSKAVAEIRISQVVVPDPLLAFAKAAHFLLPKENRKPGISPQAFIHPTARVGRDVSILPLAYVGRDAEVGDGVVLFPGAVVGERARIGDRTVVHPNVSILHDCVVGRDVILHAGTVVGSDGFGFARDGAYSPLKIPQVGIVQIDDDVEIGANCCIDRATLGKTWIQRGVKTDNLVQIAHNVTVGEGTLVVAQTGISGSVRIGRQVVIGGQVGIGDHIEIGDRAMIGSQSGVAKSLAPGEVVSGTPTMPHRLWLKTSSLLRRLPEFLDRLRRLETRLASLEQGAGRPAGSAKNIRAE